MLDTEMLIGSKFVAGTEAAEAVINPKTEETIVKLPDASTVQVDEAVDAATKAFQTWSRTTPAERSALLLKLADAIDEAGRNLRHTRSAELRQAAHPRFPGRDACGVGLFPVLCRHGAQHARSGCRRIHGRPHLDDPTRSSGRDRLHRAMELSPDDGRPGSSRRLSPVATPSSSSRRSRRRSPL